MKVLCPECLTHFDDSYQAVECPGTLVPHPTNNTSPLFDHIVNTRRARGLGSRTIGGGDDITPSWASGAM